VTTVLLAALSETVTEFFHYFSCVRLAN